MQNKWPWVIILSKKKKLMRWSSIDSNGCSSEDDNNGENIKE